MAHSVPVDGCPGTAARAGANIIALGLYQFSLIRTDGPNRACRET
jgi:hypothetical protein